MLCLHQFFNVGFLQCSSFNASIMNCRPCSLQDSKESTNASINPRQPKSDFNCLAYLIHRPILRLISVTSIAISGRWVPQIVKACLTPQPMAIRAIAYHINSIAIKGSVNLQQVRSGDVQSGYSVRFRRIFGRHKIRIASDEIEDKSRILERRSMVRFALHNWAKSPGSSPLRFRKQYKKSCRAARKDHDLDIQLHHQPTSSILLYFQLVCFELLNMAKARLNTLKIALAQAVILALLSVDGSKSHWITQFLMEILLLLTSLA